MSSVGKMVPGRLWSLWDIMHKLRSDHFFKAYEHACVTHQSFTLAKGGVTLHLPARDLAEMVDRFSTWAEECTALGLTGAAASINRAVVVLKECPAVAPDLVEINTSAAMRVQTALSQATSRISDDLSTQVLLALDPRRIHLYEQPKIFGDEVFDAFPSANEDISEAGTCLALDRGTASVMHLMRVLEAGLSVLAAAVGVKQQNNWGFYVQEIDKELAAKAKSSGARSADEQFYAEASTSIDNMRRAWRNPSMHPDKAYSVDRAEEIMNAVRFFMRHLATKLHE
jgi:hypothetical protein